MGPHHLRRTGTAGPTATRAHNRSIVLQHLFQSGPESRAELARVTGLTRVTMSTLVDSLLQEGLVSELGAEERSGKVGKRGTLVGLSHDTWCIPAINLTNDGALSGAILTLSGHITERIHEDRRLPEGREGVDVLAGFCQRLISRATSKVLGLGVSSPGVISPEGIIEQAPNRGWFDVDLAGILSHELGVPVHVANDANCLTLAEYSFGHPGGHDLLSIVVGQGLGAGLVCAGALVHGAEDAAGEIGHVTAMDERDLPGSTLGTPTVCACGRTGCLETLLSESALRRHVEGLDAAGRSKALAAIGNRLGNVLAPIVATLNLSDIVVSGPSDLLESSLVEAAARTVRERTLPRSHRTLQVRLSSLGPDGALQGAAVLVLSGRLGIA